MENEIHGMTLGLAFKAVAEERARWEKVVAGLVEALETLVSNVDCARGLLQNSPIEANGGNWGILSTTKATAALAAAREMMEGI